MFQNSHQSGQHFELFDPKCTLGATQPTATRTKCFEWWVPPASCAATIKTSRVQQSLSSGFILEVEDNKVVFPRDDKLELCLLQQFLNVQVCVTAGANFALEFVMTDSSKVPSEPRRPSAGSSTQTWSAKRKLSHFF